MSQPPSSSSSHPPRPPHQDTQRVLRRPHERFADLNGPTLLSPQGVSNEGETPQGSTRRSVPPSAGSASPHHNVLHHDAPQASEANREARHLSPRQARKRAGERRRAARKEKMEAGRRSAGDPREHKRRARAERNFAAQAREEAPGTHSARLPLRKRSPGLWKNLRRAALAIVCLCVAQGVLLALTAPQFRLQSFQISGLAETPEIQVDAIASQLVGQNVVRARISSVEQELKNLPTVSDAVITRQVAWPPRASVIVTERLPMVKVGAGNLWWVVDGSGVPFRRARKEDAGDKALQAVTITLNRNGDTLVPVAGKPLQPSEWRRVSTLVAALREDNRAGNPAWRLRRVQFDRFGAASLRVLLDSPQIATPIPVTGPEAFDGTAGEGRVISRVESAAPAGNTGGQRELWLRLGDNQWPEKLVRARLAMAYFDKTGRQAAILDMGTLGREVWTPRGMEEVPIAVDSLAKSSAADPTAQIARNAGADPAVQIAG